MGKKPYMEFYVNDFRADTLGLTATTSGIWIKALCEMHWKQTGTITGTPAEVAAICGCKISELEKASDQLSRQKVATVTFNHDIVTIMSRRITREIKEREQARIRKTRERSHASVAEKSENVTTPLSSSSSSSSSNTREESEISSSDTPLFVEGQDPYDLAEFLAEQILEHNDRASVPNLATPAGQKWCKVFDLMIRCDNLDPEEIAAIILWCTTDDFWQTNILSPAKLRKQYGRLYGEAKKAGADLKMSKDE